MFTLPGKKVMNTKKRSTHALFIWQILFFSTLFFSQNLHGKKEKKLKKILRASHDKTILQFDFEDFNYKKAPRIKGKKRIFHEKFGRNAVPIQKKGAPDLKKISSTLAIPDSVKMKARIINKNYVDIEDVEIPPSKGPVKRNTDLNSISLEYGVEYQKDRFYPKKVVELGETFILRGHRGQTLNIYPSQYNPVRKILRVYKQLTVEVKAFEDGMKNTGMKKKRKNKKKKIFKKIYKKIFDNYETKKTRSSNDPSEKKHLLIISHDDFYNDIKRLARWKREKGIFTTEFKVSEIGSTYESIKQFLIDNYEENDWTHLLLVGDMMHIPSRYKNGASSDPSYGYLVGDDHYPELIVGRFSVESKEDLKSQIDKTISYEKYNLPISNWLHHASGIASEEGEHEGDKKEADWTHLDKIRDLLLANNYTHVDRIYQTEGAVREDITFAVNQGRGLINYTGHGTETNWTTTGFNVQDIQSLSNKYMWPFIFVVACKNGAFEKDGLTFAEAWLRAVSDDVAEDPTGAIAVVASSIDQDWAAPMKAQDEFNFMLSENDGSEEEKILGNLFQMSVLKMIESYGQIGNIEAENWQIFGDPTLSLRTHEAKDLRVSHNSFLFEDDKEFLIESSHKKGTATLSYEGQIITTEKFSDHKFYLPLKNFDFENISQIKLVITAFNHRAYEKDIEIFSKEEANLKVSEIISKKIEEENNFETKEIELILSNSGYDQATNVSLNVLIDDHRVSGKNLSKLFFFDEIKEDESIEQDLKIYFDLPLEKLDTSEPLKVTLNFQDQTKQWIQHINYFIKDHNPKCFSGDVNEDSMINIFDMIDLVKIIIEEKEKTKSSCSNDMNQDESLDILDIIYLQKKILDQKET
ncbi:MAG: hypothetical protein CMP11_03775 [Zetaproteobacteria bacterium]|nr:hypothetical protein [Pseudobdellovibrionaceae bacterium]